MRGTHRLLKTFLRRRNVSGEIRLDLHDLHRRIRVGAERRLDIAIRVDLSTSLRSASRAGLVVVEEELLVLVRVEALSEFFFCSKEFLLAFICCLLCLPSD